ncbi:hypothetical protein PM3016_2327 [Paenibacillus mucilaginosus 3016]|uniref:Uncharacterized protein n=2 Tax=Paenibacillus mucilaginosus TaxID=61624 RepID=H6NJD6_9BACL|nr:hypothetical protein KNP414_02034 [Paenibacillus mucilaginosus KNP414]AFC29215.1 hypothetical protein PM3016_2327 [Paenibacillus mucilaginosus 3016]
MLRVFTALGYIVNAAMSAGIMSIVNRPSELIWSAGGLF